MNMRQSVKLGTWGGVKKQLYLNVKDVQTSLLSSPNVR